MKLITCLNCKDIVLLSMSKRSCVCAASTGKYLDDVRTVRVSGDCIVLGISNPSFKSMVEGKYGETDIFVIREPSNDIIRDSDSDEPDEPDAFSCDSGVRQP